MKERQEDPWRAEHNDGRSGVLPYPHRKTRGVRTPVNTTPGPWTTEHHGHVVTLSGFSIVSPTANPRIALAYVANRTDAALIEAAPELLAALKRIVSAADAAKSYYEITLDLVIPARAAIAKAEGRS